MVQEKQIDVSDDELEKIDLAGRALFGEKAEELPRGKILRALAEHTLDTHRDVDAVEDTLEEQGIEDIDDVISPRL